MRITIELHGAFGRLNAGGAPRTTLPVAPGATVAEVLERVGVDLREPWNAALDGRLAAATDRVHEGSLLIVFSPIEGG
jgi:hypothetical protein